MGFKAEKKDGYDRGKKKKKKSYKQENNVVNVNARSLLECKDPL